MNSITELWYGNITPMESFGENNPGLRQAERLMLRGGVKLEELLSGEEKQLFLRYCENHAEYVSRSNEQAFREGFCLAAKLITEALSATPSNE